MTFAEAINVAVRAGANVELINVCFERNPDDFDSWVDDAILHDDFNWDWKVNLEMQWIVDESNHPFCHTKITILEENFTR